MRSRHATSKMLIVYLLLGCGIRPKAGQSPEAARDRPSPWEVAINKINPRNIDYGLELERERQSFLRQLDDPRLCCEGIGLALVLSGWTLVLHQAREKRRREIIAAELLAHYHNALMEARIRLKEALVANRELRAAAETATASAAAEQLPVSDFGGFSQVDEKSDFSSSPPSRRPNASRSALARGSEAFAAGSDAVAQELEQKLSESRAREKLLEKELAMMSAQRRSPRPAKIRTPLENERPAQ